MGSISGISSSSNAWAALSSQRSQHQAKMFAKVDTDGSGGVDQSELSTMLSDISAKTGTSLGDSKALFSKMDSNSDGTLSSDELAKGMKDLMPPPSTLDFAQSQSTGGTDSAGSTQASGEVHGHPPPDGPPPAGGPTGAGEGSACASGSSNTSGTSSASTTYDPLDINQDGTVSQMERLAGALKDLAQTSGSDSSGNSANSEIAKLAQKLYEQISSSLTSGSTTSSSQLSATA